MFINALMWILLEGIDVNYFSCSFDLCVVLVVVCLGGVGECGPSCLDLLIRTTICCANIKYGHTHLLQKKARKTDLFVKYSLSWRQ